MRTQCIPMREQRAIERAVEALESGGLVAFPTDTVYGLAAHLRRPAAIARIFAVKGRPAQKAIPVLIGAPEQFPLVAAAVGQAVERLAQAFWPGPLTMVLPRRPELPSELGEQPTVGVRMPDHPVALALLRAAGPLAVTSANRSGEPECRQAEEVERALGGQIELILDGGRTPGGVPSTVVDCTGEQPRLLRPGPIALEEVLARWHGG